MSSDSREEETTGAHSRVRVLRRGDDDIVRWTLRRRNFPEAQFSIGLANLENTLLK